MGRGGGRGGGGGFSGGGRGGGFGGGRGGGGRSSGAGRGAGRGGGSFGGGGLGGGGFGHGGYNRRPRHHGPRVWPVFLGGFGRRRYSRGGGGCGFMGCGSIFTVMIFLFIMFSFLSTIGNFGTGGGGIGGGSGDITSSTVEREPLPAGSVDETDYYTDELGWIGNHTQMVDGLRHFYNETGVQPHVHIIGDVEGNPDPTQDELAAYANALYDDLFTDEAHLLLVFLESSPNDYDTYYIVGSQARSVIDTEAGDILLDYLDRYYFDDGLTDEQYFSNSFRDAADRIMDVTTSPWIPVLSIFGLVIVLYILYKWWKTKQDSKEKEAKRTEDMLNKPIHTFGGSEAEELSKKYQDKDSTESDEDWDNY